MSSPHLRIRILVPLACVLSLLLIAFVLGLHHLQAQGIRKDCAAKLAAVQDLYKLELDQDAALMSAALEVLTRHPELQKAWLARDRETLLSLVAPIFKIFKSEHRITHFYFNDPAGVIFLRAHRPERHGDTLTRFTMKQAIKTRQPVRGIELGSLGTFTLRVIYPWFIDGQLVGYLELGEEIEHVTQRLHTILGTDIVVFIKKDLLVRKEWEASMKTLGRQVCWDDFADMVAIDRTSDTLSPGVARVAMNNFAARSGGRNPEMVEAAPGLYAGFIPLAEVSGRDAGGMVVTLGVAEQQAALSKLTVLISIICTTAAAFLIGLFFVLLTRVQRSLDAAKALDAAKTRAEAVAAHTGAFLANMSHEIRTPMTAILGYAESLLDPDISHLDRRDMVQIIRRNGEHLLQILNDILDISKIEANRLDVECVPASPVEIVADVESLMHVRSHAKGLSFEVEYRGPIPAVIQTDPLRLRQILVNLIGNAVKFTDAGGVCLVVSLADAETPHPVLRFEVSDTGLGITKEQMSRLFQPFSQGDASTTRKFGGTGLGLAISTRLAAMLGGGIAVQSTPGQGSTFTVMIGTGPLDGVMMLDRSAEATKVTPARPAGSDRPPARLDGRILLAEDCLDNQRLIVHILTKAGAEIVVVGDGRRAIEEVLAAASGSGEQEGNCRPFDVVLMDVQMPAMDGYEAVRRLREKGYTGRIIALTAHALASDREKCLGAGCDDYLTKPINRAILLETIRKHLDPTTAERPDHAGTLAAVSWAG